MQTSKIARVAEDSTASLRPMAEANASLLPSLEIGLGLDAISALGDRHGPVRIHAVPRLPSQRVALSGRCRDHLSYKALFPSPPEAPEQAADWLDDSLDDELQVQLSRFQRSEEIPSDVREELSVMLTWLKLNQSRLNQDESRQFNLMVFAFLRGQLGLPTSMGSHQQLSSGLLIPRLNNQDQVAPPDLEPRQYTSKELAEHLSYDEATIRRKAAGSWQEGAGPQPLKGKPSWYVVGRGNSGGGRRRGWKFQQRKRADMP